MGITSPAWPSTPAGRGERKPTSFAVAVTSISTPPRMSSATSKRCLDANVYYKATLSRSSPSARTKTIFAPGGRGRSIPCEGEVVLVKPQHTHSDMFAVVPHHAGLRAHATDVLVIAGVPSRPVNWSPLLRSILPAASTSARTQPMSLAEAPRRHVLSAWPPEASKPPCGGGSSVACESVSADASAS